MIKLKSSSNKYEDCKMKIHIDVQFIDSIQNLNLNSDVNKVTLNLSSN